MLKLIANLLDSRWLLSFICIGVTLFLMLLPGSETKKIKINLFQVDKLAHIMLFGACAFSLFMDMRLKQTTNSKLFIVSASILILGTALGYIIELVQANYLGRTFAVDDVFADAIGLLIGLLIAYFGYEFILQRFSTSV